MVNLSGDDTANAHVRSVLSAIATGRAIPAPPAGSEWVRRASAHGVLSIVAAAHMAAAHPLPAEADRARFAAAGQITRVLADLSLLARVLDGSGVPWVVFKGPVLGLVVHRLQGVRAFADLDVLVRPEDVCTVETLLRNVGAMPDAEPNWRWKLRAGHAELDWFLPRGTNLDLHWHVVGTARVRRSFHLATEGLISRSVPVGLDAGSGNGQEHIMVRTLDPLDTVIHLAVHGCLSGADRLRWAFDLQQALIRYEPAPSELVARASASRTCLPLAVMVDRATRYLDPGLSRYADALGGSSWRSTVRAWSAAFPPSAGLHRGLSGRALFSATRQNSSRTLLALARETAGRFRPQNVGRAPTPDRAREAYRRYLDEVIANPGLALRGGTLKPQEASPPRRRPRLDQPE